MHLVHNERTKLTAAWLNGLATALLAAGAFAPFIAWLYGLSALPIPLSNLLGLAFACSGVGVSIHIIGLTLLGRLRE